MKTQHHTKVEWKLNKGSKGILGGAMKPIFIIQTNFKEITNGPQAEIAIITPNQTAQQVGNNNFSHTIELNESLANAKLIAEAGTVTNECGLTPRQLLEQRNELLSALKELRDLIDIGYLVRDISKDDNYQYFLKQGIAITKALTLTNEAIKKATE